MTQSMSFEKRFNIMKTQWSSNKYKKINDNLFTFLEDEIELLKNDKKNIQDFKKACLLRINDNLKGLRASLTWKNFFNNLFTFIWDFGKALFTRTEFPANPIFYQRNLVIELEQLEESLQSFDYVPQKSDKIYSSEHPMTALLSQSLETPFSNHSPKTDSDKTYSPDNPMAPSLPHEPVTYSPSSSSTAGLDDTYHLSKPATAYKSHKPTLYSGPSSKREFDETSSSSNSIVTSLSYGPVASSSSFSPTAELDDTYHPSKPATAYKSYKPTPYSGPSSKREFDEVSSSNNPMVSSVPYESVTYSTSSSLTAELDDTYHPSKPATAYKSYEPTFYSSTSSERARNEAYHSNNPNFPW